MNGSKRPSFGLPAASTDVSARNVAWMLAFEMVTVLWRTAAWEINAWRGSIVTSYTHFSSSLGINSIRKHIPSLYHLRIVEGTSCFLFSYAFY